MNANTKREKNHRIEKQKDDKNLRQGFKTHIKTKAKKEQKKRQREDEDPTK
jgi:hypothetical protein